MRIVVTGGREQLDRDMVFTVLDDFKRKHDVTEIAHGGQRKWMPLTQRWRGTDYLAGEWAAERGVPCEEFPVTEEEWKRLHRAAGPVRNRRMINDFQPDAVLAFPGQSGTADCVQYALDRGLVVYGVTKLADGTIDVALVSTPKLF